MVVAGIRFAGAFAMLFLYFFAWIVCGLCVDYARTMRGLCAESMRMMVLLAVGMYHAME